MQLVTRPLVLTLDELRVRFRKHSVTAVLMCVHRLRLRRRRSLLCKGCVCCPMVAERLRRCAGNRRNEMSRVSAVKGVGWDAGALGNATWGGARLCDVLAAAGVVVGGLHVEFEGQDAIKEHAFKRCVP